MLERGVRNKTSGGLSSTGRGFGGGAAQPRINLGRRRISWLAVPCE